MTSRLAFETEFASWRIEYERKIVNLRVGLGGDNSKQLEAVVLEMVYHFDEFSILMNCAIKQDVVHVLSDAWMPSAVRVLMWMGGVLTSRLLDFVSDGVEGLTHEQRHKVCVLVKTSVEEEDLISVEFHTMEDSLVRFDCQLMYHAT